VSGPDLRVVVLTYGTGGAHGPLFESLQAEGVAEDRIVVVHNPSRPGETPTGVPPGCELIVSSYNLGYAAGMNAGMRAVLEHGCELLLLATADARLREGCLAKMLRAAEEEPRYAVLGPSLLFPGSDRPYSFGGLSNSSGLSHHRLQRPPSSPAVSECDWVDGGTLLLRAEALREIGLYEERFWGYYEDDDLGLRARRAGFRVGIVVAAEADQDPGGTKRVGAWSYLMTRNGIEYARRAAGRRGLFAAIAKAAWTTLLELARCGARIVRVREGPPVERWAIAVGAVRGTADFIRGRWGPPPNGLPGSSDMSNLRPPA